MARRHGRCRRGERLRSGVPHGHWKTITHVAGLRRPGMVAPMVIDGPINRDAFVACVQQVLVPDLSPGDIVIMDNLPSHKTPPRATSSKQLGPSCSSFRPAAPTSTRSSRYSPSLRRTCARPPSAPSTAYEMPLAATLISTHHRSAPLLRKRRIRCRLIGNRSRMPSCCDVASKIGLSWPPSSSALRGGKRCPKVWLRLNHHAVRQQHGGDCADRVKSRSTLRLPRSAREFTTVDRQLQPLRVLLEGRNLQLRHDG